MKKRSRNGLKELLAGLGIVAVCLTFARCTPIAPTVGKDRFYGDGLSESARPKIFGSSYPSQTALRVKVFSDGALFDAETEKYADSSKITLSDRELSVLFNELKEHKKTEIRMETFVTNEVIILVQIKPLATDATLSDQEKDYLGAFILDIKSGAGTTWLLGVGDKVDSDASAWIRNRLAKVLIIYSPTVSVAGASN